MRACARWWGRCPTSRCALESRPWARRARACVCACGDLLTQGRRGGAQIQPALEQVVTPIASQLQRMADPSVTVTDQEALDGLDRLQAVLKHFKPRNLPREKPDPGVELMKSMWDTVSALAARFVGRPEVVESLMLVIRRSINGSTPERWQPLVRPMLQLVSQHFHPQHSPGFLYLIAMAIREFASVSRLYSQSKVPQLTPALAAERDEGHPEMAPMVLGTMDSAFCRRAEGAPSSPASPRALGQAWWTAPSRLCSPWIRGGRSRSSWGTFSTRSSSWCCTVPPERPAGPSSPPFCTRRRRAAAPT